MSMSPRLPDDSPIFEPWFERLLGGLTVEDDRISLNLHDPIDVRLFFSPNQARVLATTLVNFATAVDGQVLHLSQGKSNGST